MCQERSAHKAHNEIGRRKWKKKAPANVGGSQVTINLLFLLAPREVVSFTCVAFVQSSVIELLLEGPFFLPLMGNGDKNRVDMIAYKYSSEGVGGGGVLIRRRRDDKCVLLSLCDIENRTILDEAIWGFVAVVCRSLSTSDRWYYVWS